MAVNNNHTQYQDIQVDTANQGALILMVYDGAIRFSEEAKERLKSGDLGGKEIYINKACNTISELQRALDLEAGREIASSLDKLYSFMTGQLALANVNNDPEPIDLVVTLLTRLRDGWDQIVESPIEVAH